MNPQPVYRIVIADDHKIVRNALHTEIAKERDMRIVGECSNGDEVVPLVTQTQANVVLLDLSMPGRSALQVLKQLVQMRPMVRVMVATASRDSETVKAFMLQGALGYFVKDDDPVDIAVGIRTIVTGQNWVSPSAVDALQDMDDSPAERMAFQLTEREAQVLRLLADGATNTDIATKLSLAEGTVKNHISNLYQRLNVHSRSEAAAWAWKYGYIERFTPPSS